MIRRADNYTRIVRTTGPAVWCALAWDSWGRPRLVRNARCPDGRRRTVYLGADADTFFSWPGRVSIAGRWVRGFVAVQTDDGTDGGAALDTVFVASEG
jgi:hypothetical protein